MSFLDIMVAVKPVYAINPLPHTLRKTTVDANPRNETALVAKKASALTRDTFVT